MPKRKPQETTPDYQPQSARRLGTFGGVFTPSILTILGVILFMRAGFVVGQGGVIQALLILGIAEAIVLLTALSISAISTNTPVAGGGAYFLISRVLGPESGGAIGLALFLAQAISVPFYILGFTEALVRAFPGAAPLFSLIAGAAALVLFAVAYIGAGWATRAQYFIMTILGLSLIALLGGSLAHFRMEQFSQNLASAYTRPAMSFWPVFAIYFPAVTGIMAGVNMSGDLKNPGRSIPWGTLAAILAGLIIYGAQMVLTGGAQSREQLLNLSFETYREQALLGLGFLVVAGVFAATLSSALASLLGAPRVMQALSRDDIIPLLRWFGKDASASGEPRRALWLTLGITLGVIALAGNDPTGGAFNVIASVVTMFFLYTYGMLNLAAFVESSGNNPSFRPRFRYYHWATALAGALGCAIAAFLIDPPAALAAAIAVVILFVAIRRRTLSTPFGDARWGFLYSHIRNQLLTLARMPVHPKNWRPTVLVLSGNPENRQALVSYADWISAGRGVVTLVDIIVGDLDNMANLRKTAMERLNKFLAANRLEAFPEAVIARDFDEGLLVLLQSHSIGPLKSNLILFGWSSDSQRALSFCSHLRAASRLGMSPLVLRTFELPSSEGPKRIDIWWRGRQNGALMVILAHLLTLNWAWSDTQIRVLRLIEDEAGRTPAGVALRELVGSARIDASVQIVVSSAPFGEILQRHSADANLVILGYNPPEPGREPAFLSTFEELLDKIPSTLLVCSSGRADLLA